MEAEEKNRRGSRAEKTGRFPANTPITQMLGKREAEALTPRARKLVKEDLVSLWQGSETRRAKALAFSDLDSIRTAFGDQVDQALPFGTDLVAGDINCCCCCCPCCCAESVASPILN